MFRRFIPFYIIILSLQCSIDAFGQDKFLVLEKPGRKKRIKFYPGDELTFKLKNSDLQITGTILDLYDSLILFADSYVKPEEIDYVKLERVEGFLSPSNGPKLVIAGVALFIIDQLNYSLLQGNKIRFDKEIACTSLAMITGGITWTSLRFTRFRNKGNRRIRIVII